MKKGNDIFPFLPVPIEKAKKWALPFRGMANVFLKVKPRLKNDIFQAGIKLKAYDYYSIALLSSFFIFFLVAVPIFLIGTYFGRYPNTLPISILIGIAVAGTALGYYFSRPKLIVFKKNALLERDLLFALRYLLIRVRSGIPLYDAMVGVTQGDFGEVSREFKKSVAEISGGVEEIRALEDMALRNSSSFFRRTIWQMANNMRSGADIGDILEEMSSSLVSEHKILIRKYGAELNPIILLYMMFSVVIPSLGIALLVVMSSFSGIQVPTLLFYAIPVGVFLLQFIFISIIRHKRPLLSV